MFALAAVLSVFAVRQVKVDYDINDYLPPESPSTTAIEVMNGAFTGGIPNMRVMVRDVTIPEALAYKEKIAAIDGVASVSVSGGVERQITVTLDAQRAAGYGLSTSYITQILQAENLLYPAGEVYNGSQKLSVTTDAQLKVAQTMGNILSRAV